MALRLILEERRERERVAGNDALTALQPLKLLAVVEARHHFAGIYQAAYQREVIEFICLLMREGLQIVHFPSYASTCLNHLLVTAIKSAVCSPLQSFVVLSPHQPLL